MAVNNFPFFKEPIPYQQKEIVTPYKKKEQRFDYFIGSLVHKAFIFRIIFFMSSFLAMILSLILLYLYSTPRYRVLVKQISNQGFLQYPLSKLESKLKLSSIKGEKIIEDILEKVLRDNKYINFFSLKALAEIQSIKNNTKKKYRNSIDVNDFQFIVDKIKKKSFSGAILYENKIVYSFQGKFSHNIFDRNDEIIGNPLNIYIKEFSLQGEIK